MSHKDQIQSVQQFIELLKDVPILKIHRYINFKPRIDKPQINPRRQKGLYATTLCQLIQNMITPFPNISEQTFRCIYSGVYSES